MIKETLRKAFYQLTAYVPRRLPRTENEYQKLKNVLTGYYGVQNNPKVWITVASHITGTHAEKLRKPWGKIANCAKRLDINYLAQTHKLNAAEDMDRDLKAKMEEQVKRFKEEQDEYEQKSQVEQEAHDLAKQTESPQGKDPAVDGLTPIEEIGIGHELPY